MAKVKVRVELNKGRRGIALGKLSKITQETLQFLSMVCRDAELPGDPDGWLAANFDNNSVDFDCECLQDIELMDVQRTNTILKAVMTNDRTSDVMKRVVRPGTRRQYSQIASAIEADEVVSFGLFLNGDAEPQERYQLSKTMAYEIERELPTTTTYYGEIQGTIHSLYKEDTPKRIRVRSLIANYLVDCLFNDELYRNMIEVLKEPRGIIFIEGEISENMGNGEIDSIKAQSFRLAPLFDEHRFNELIGCAPDLTGNLTTEEFIERFRDNGGHS